VVVSSVTNGVFQWWGPALAFAAGVLSFASPCVLPLVPGYLSFVTGGVGSQQEVRRPVVPILMFIAGFTVIFTLVGAFTASVLSRWLRSAGGQRFAGGVVLLFGAFMLLYALRLGLPWLYREERPFLSRVRPGPSAAFPLGMAFAVGWTPCVGPVLGVILTLAANQGGSLRAALLLFFYSMGLGVPFVLLGLGIRRLMTAFRFFSRNYTWFALASGVVLVGIGVLLVTGQWTRLIAPLGRVINRFNPAL
jgi:cytochrome c-type biogenesis protein